VNHLFAYTQPRLRAPRRSVFQKTHDILDVIQRDFGCIGSFLDVLFWNRSRKDLPDLRSVRHRRMIQAYLRGQSSGSFTQLVEKVYKHRDGNPSFESKYVHERNHAFSTTVDLSTIRYARPGLSAWAAQLLCLRLNKGVHRLAHLKDPSDEVRAYLPASTNGRVKNACTVSWSEIENFSLNDSISLIQREEKIVWDMAESMAAPTRKGVTV
ncbi:hypothetical protein EDD85DRAFT_982097, partial [Armillaria nabsnona]